MVGGAGAEAAPKIRFTAGNRGQFYLVLKQRVMRKLAAHGADRYGDWRLAVKGAVYGVCAAASYAALVTATRPPGVLLLLAVAYEVAVLLLAINIGHDAAHNAVSRRAWVNRLLQFVTFGLLGADAYLWRLRHVKSHHTFPNVNGCDIDIDENPFLRLSPNHPRRPWQRYQHLYAPLAYWVVALHTIFYQDFVYLRKRTLANMRDIRHPWWAYVQFAAGKALYLAATFVVPLSAIDLPAWQILLGVLIASGVSSILFVALLIGTHFAEEPAFPALDGAGRLPHDWAEHALLTAVDWSPTSRLAHFIAGGVNAHAAHHLFPTLCHVHYRAIAGIVRDTAQEFGLRYHVTTLPRMIASHFRFLRALGRDAVAPQKAPAGQACMVA
jgi:linoleoyl-CoA desaturase